MAQTVHSSARSPAARDRLVALGLVVRAHRKRLGISQERLGELASCDRQTINRTENAAYALALPRVFLIADALGVPASQLLAEVEQLLQEGTGG